MDNKMILSPIGVDDLADLIRGIIKEEINNCHEDKLQAQFLSTSEVCRLFNPTITRQTIDNWSKKGLLEKHHISNRIYYRYSEVVAAVTKIKKYNR